jgi:peptide/nickel transport system substrate-binding protein
MDPGYFVDTASAEIQQNVYEPLLQFVGNGPNTTVVPWLTQNYTVSSDGMTYTFNLRQGITFQDGSAFNATAVVFSINRVVLMDSTASSDYLLDGPHAPGLINGSSYYSHAVGSGASTYNQSQVNAYINSHGVEIGANPYQVIFHLGFPFPSFPYIIADVFIVSPTTVISHWTVPTDGHGYITGITAGEEDQYMKTHASGSGPFVLNSWDQTTNNIVLSSNSKYWGTPNNSGPAKIPEVDINYVSSDSARVLDLKSGAADISDIPTNDYFAFIDKTSWLANHSVVVTTPGINAPGPYATLDLEFLTMNYVIHNQDGSVASFQPFQNKNFRVAMSDAVNVSDIVRNVINGFGIQANEAVPPGEHAYNSSIPVYYNFNLTDAKGNLTLAAKSLGLNASNPKTIVLAYQIGDAAGQAISTQLANNINNMQLGVTINVSPQPVSTFIGALVAGQLAFGVLSFVPDYPDSPDYLAIVALPGNLASFVSYNNTVVVSKLDQALGETNQTLRAQLLQQVQILINQDVAYIWFYYPSVFGETGQVFRTWVHGFQFLTQSNGIFFYQLSKS